jgi:hypothetical protein
MLPSYVTKARERVILKRGKYEVKTYRLLRKKECRLKVEFHNMPVHYPNIFLTNAVQANSIDSDVTYSGPLTYELNLFLRAGRNTSWS